MSRVTVPLRGIIGAEDDVVERGVTTGFVGKIVDDYLAGAKPRFTHREYEALVAASGGEENDVLAHTLRGFPGDWAGAFCAHNKLLVGDSGESIFVPNIPDFPIIEEEEETDAMYQAYNDLDEVRAQQTRDEAARREAAKLVPKYFLQQFFTDHQVAEKLNVTPQFRDLVARIAVINPSSACAAIVGYVKKNHDMDVIIRVGDYARGKKAARKRIIEAARDFRCESYDLTVAGDKVMLSSRSEFTLQLAEIVAPVAESQVLDALYRTMCNQGPAMVSKIHSMDMAVLGIEFSSEAVDPGVGYEDHGGELQFGMSGSDVRLMSEEVSRYESIVWPVFVNGKVMGSAIRKTKGEFFVLWHVVVPDEEGENHCATLRLPGGEVRLELERQVAHDTWIAGLSDCGDVDVSADPVFCRQPEMGESVYVVYSTVHGVEVSDRSTVCGVERGSFSFYRFAQARVGISGGAVVSDVDGALLGIYTGSNSEFSVASVLHSPEKLVLEKKMAVKVAVPEVTFGGGGVDVYNNLKSRGLGSAVSSIYSALSPVSSLGVEIGTEFRRTGIAVATFDPSLWDGLISASGESPKYHSVQDGCVRDLSVFESDGPNGAKVKLGEQVFVLSDEEGDCVLSRLHTVDWVSADGKKFRLDGVPSFSNKPSLGGVVVNFSDCEPVGMLSKVVSFREKSSAECCSWLNFLNKKDGESVRSAAKDLLLKVENVLPKGLALKAWSDSHLEVLINREGELALSIASVGDAGATALMMKTAIKDMEISPIGPSMRILDTGWLDSAAKSLVPDDPNLFGMKTSDRVFSFRIFLGLLFMNEGPDVLASFLSGLNVGEHSVIAGLRRTSGERPHSM